MQFVISLIILWGFLLSAGCQTTFAGDEPAATSAPISPPQGDPQMTPSLTIPANAGLQNLIDKAMADLAQRLSIPANQIKLAEATPVVWPDASLGCPLEGMVYAQVLTPGYLIRLESGNQEFEYHASQGTYIVYCENPTPPVPGIPENT